MGQEDWKVLVIDDEEGIRRVVSIVLTDAGYQVLTAQDGENGLRLCLEISPQIIITDIRMPGMDGIEVLQRIKETSPEKEVIVITAFGEMEMAIRALQLNASDFITKPINNEALFIALGRAKERYTTRKELLDYTTLIEERWMDTAEEMAKVFSFKENLIEGSIDGIMGCDRERKIITFNKSLEKMLGYREEEVCGKMFLNQFFPVGAAEKFEEELYSEEYGGKNRIALRETTLIANSGLEIPVQFSATVLHQDGEEIGIVGFFRDLREIRRLEQQFADQARILHQDKMMSLGRLAASVVHEINNPLSGILNYVRLMIRVLNRGPLSEEQREKFQRYLGLVEQETSRCSHIVSGLLTFSRKSPPAFEMVSVADLIRRSAVLSKHKLELQNIVLEVHVEPDLPSVEGDFNQLQQCLINLIFNAIDAMPGGGTLTISGYYDPSTACVTVTVKDTGSGVSEADLPHIFEPFFSTKKEGYGVGLGLSTVYGILERHKGTIKVESRLGEGSTFMLQLPIPPA